MTNYIKYGTAAFVIPFWSDGKPHRLKYLNDALESIYSQTDNNWKIYLVDDASIYEPDKRYLMELEDKNNNIKVIFSEASTGPGDARNKGIIEAYKEQCPFICFLDSDDIASHNRVDEVRKTFLEDSEADIAYSSFKVIDEENNAVSDSDLLEGIKIIISDIENRPLYGYDTWIEMAVERDTLTIPSALNVKTTLAAKHLFPNYARFHEDTHTWLRYSASGAKVVYIPQIPSKYRIPQKVNGSESRERAGGIEAFNRLRVKIIMQGLVEAIEMAKKRGVIDNDKGLEIMTRYCLNVAAMIKKEGTVSVAKELVEQAKTISSDKFYAFKDKYSLEGLV